MRSLLTAGLIALVVPGCIDNGILGVGEGEEMGEEGGEGGGGGGGGGGGSGTTATPRIMASVDKTTVTSELGKTETLTITVQSMDGFTGSVPITPTMAAGFTVTANPATLDLAAGATATATVEVKIPSDAAELAPQLKIDLGGSAPTSVTSDLTIANQYTVTIPAGTGTGAHNGIPRTQIALRSGAQLIFHNGDSIQHVIHGDMGVPHENITNGGMPGSDYKIDVTNDGTWYCHTHGADSANTRIVNVQ